MIVRSLPHTLVSPILKCIRRNVYYVSIFLILFMLLIAFIFQRYKIKSRLSSVSEEKPFIH